MDLSPSIPAGTAAAAAASRPAPPPADDAEASPAAAAPPAAFGPLVLPAGLPGFPEARAFALKPLPGAGDFALLESLEAGGPRFVVLQVGEPAAIFGPAAMAEAAAALGVAGGDLMFLAIVTLSDGPAGRRAHVNLRAPVVLDRVGRSGRQIVLADPSLPLRHPLERAAA